MGIILFRAYIKTVKPVSLMDARGMPEDARGMPEGQMPEEMPEGCQRMPEGQVKDARGMPEGQMPEGQVNDITTSE